MDFNWGEWLEQDIILDYAIIGNFDHLAHKTNWFNWISRYRFWSILIIALLLLASFWCFIGTF